MWETFTSLIAVFPARVMANPFLFASVILGTTATVMMAVRIFRRNS